MRLSSNNRIISTLTTALLIICFTSIQINLSDAKTKNPIVQESNPDKPTHFLKIKNLTFGFSDQGGGYLNYLDTGNGFNLVDGGYGRGWQGDIRDRMHNGRYNPTQAGFSPTAGTPVNLTKSGKRITIEQFNMPLFGDPVYDFTEHENLAADDKKYNDQDKTDTDGLDERHWSQDDELRSEFDFYGYYEDVTSAQPNSIPVLKFYARYTYERNPKAILQFGRKARLPNGKPVLDDRFRAKDISKTLEGNQAPMDIDLSRVVFTNYGIRILKKSGFQYGMRVSNGEWEIEKPTKLRKLKRLSYHLKSKNQPKAMDIPLMIMANGDNPEKANAIGLFIPESPINRQQTIGLDPNDNIIYREDRRSRYFIFFTHLNKTQTGMRSRMILHGLLSPVNLMQAHTKAVKEGIENELYILYGTPEKILKTAQKIGLP